MRSIIFTLASMLVISCAGDPPTTGEQVETVITPATTGCSHIIFCDAPGGTGTICQQDACTVSQAELECYQDLGALGCQCHSPAQLRLRDGTIHVLPCPN
jgi:hypothetical protein